jgi:hypothetical protein
MIFMEMWIQAVVMLPTQAYQVSTWVIHSIWDRALDGILLDFLYGHFPRVCFGNEGRACYLPHASFLLFFDPENGGDVFLRNVAWLSTDYMFLYPSENPCI